MFVSWQLRERLTRMLLLMDNLFKGSLNSLANFRLAWKNCVGTNTTAYFAVLSVMNKKRIYYKIVKDFMLFLKERKILRTGANFINLFTVASYDFS